MPPSKAKPLPDWERVLSAAAHLQGIFPDAVMVGGSAAAQHAGHRMSVDADHVVSDLRTTFDDVLAKLESVAGWETARVKRPVLILGSLDGIETGIRQLKRSAPLETITVDVGGHPLTIPTEEEMLRIKGLLILDRNKTRDYLDFAAMLTKLRNERAVYAMLPFDELYPQPNGESPMQQLIAQLASPTPTDLEEVNLAEYKNLIPRWQNWDNVKTACADFSAVLFDGYGARGTGKLRKLNEPDTSGPTQSIEQT